MVWPLKIVVEGRQRRQQHAHTMKNSPDHAADKSNHLPVANKADKKQMMSVSRLYWVIRLIECNWVMHRSAERRHQTSGETGGGGGGIGRFRNWGMQYNTRAMRLAVNDSHPRNQLILIDWTEWSPLSMILVTQRLSMLPSQHTQDTSSVLTVANTNH